MFVAFFGVDHLNFYRFHYHHRHLHVLHLVVLVFVPAKIRIHIHKNYVKDLNIAENILPYTITAHRYPFARLLICA